MTTVHRNRNWKIQVFGREHGVPHFHVWTPIDILPRHE
jgi:hypothetical protein